MAPLFKGIISQASFWPIVEKWSSKVFHKAVELVIETSFGLNSLTEDLLDLWEVLAHWWPATFYAGRRWKYNPRGLFLEFYGYFKGLGIGPQGGASLYRTLFSTPSPEGSAWCCCCIRLQNNISYCDVTFTIFLLFSGFYLIWIKHTQLVEWCEAIKGEGSLAEFIKLIAVKWQRVLTL